MKLKYVARDNKIYDEKYLCPISIENLILDKKQAKLRIFEYEYAIHRPKLHLQNLHET